MKSTLKTDVEELRALLGGVHALEPSVVAAATLLANALGGGHKLLACGNGGSAADASHLTTEFVSRFNRERRPYPAISLAVHGGDLTALGNDYDFKEIFARQVHAFGKPGDVLMAFTTSGRSENVRRALVSAKEMQMASVAFLGRDGGACLGLADIDLLVESHTTARIQEVHKLLLHSICAMVEIKLEELDAAQDRA
ncbi:MAG TPA: SIS domain-containing protein [Terracidiphilus sp.]|jgi:D-sedoheptulose 7-phosphate isomerase|nr:SIS domain-containing protein [Terracidiphilus sp.]